jgi:Flp pilus assembly protein TadD
MQLRAKAIVSLLLVVATFCVYWPVRHYDFVNYDDNDYVTSNPHVQAGLTKEGIFWAFTQFHGEKTYWHPLTWMSHMLDCQLFGLNAGAHHLVSVGLHALNGALLFLFLAYLTGSTWRSALIAALFALHPIQVDTVAWITERKNILSGLFWILTLWAYVAYTRRRTGYRYLLTLVLFALGLMCKPTLVMLPCILLLVDFWPLARLTFTRLSKDANVTAPSSAGWARNIGLLVIEKVPFFAFSLACGLLTLWSHDQLGIREEVHGLPVYWRLENAVVSYARYLGKLVWPQKLCVLYLHPGEWPEETVFLCLLVLIGITTFVVWRRRREPFLLFAWLWFLLVLLPTIGIRQVGIQAMADRFAYLPSIGIFVGVVWGAAEVLRQLNVPKTAVGPITAAVPLAFAVVTPHQIRHWQNSVSLWEQALHVNPQNFVALHNLGVTLTGEGRLQDALDKENTCVLARPDMLEAHLQKGFIEILQGKPEAAFASYKNVIALRKEAAELIQKSGLELMENGKVDEALLLFSTLGRLTPNDADVHFQLGLLFTAKKKPEESIRSYREAIRLNPKSPVPLNNLAWLLATDPDPKIRDGKEAIELAQRACELSRHTIPVFIGTLAAAYAEAGRFEEASQTAGKACEVALKTGEASAVAANRKLQELYRKQQPFRQKS